MSRRHPNPRLAKIHRNYTVEEVAGLFGVRRNTVREWVKRGLRTCDDRRPTLILGSDLVAFLHARRAKNKRSCKPGEIYCVRCRAPRAPAGNMADYQPVTETLGDLIAICLECDTIMYRRVSLAKLGQVRGNLDITMPQALARIVARLLSPEEIGEHEENVEGARQHLRKYRDVLAGKNVATAADIPKA